MYVNISLLLKLKYITRSIINAASRCNVDHFMHLI